MNAQSRKAASPLSTCVALSAWMFFLLLCPSAVRKPRRPRRRSEPRTRTSCSVRQPDVVTGVRAGFTWHAGLHRPPGPGRKASDARRPRRLHSDSALAMPHLPAGTQALVPSFCRFHVQVGCGPCVQWVFPRFWSGRSIQCHLMHVCTPMHIFI